MRRGWCPRCQKITNQIIEETLLIRQEICEECKTLLFRHWKVSKKISQEAQSND